MASNCFSIIFTFQNVVPSVLDKIFLSNFEKEFQYYFTDLGFVFIKINSPYNFYFIF